MPRSIGYSSISNGFSGPTNTNNLGGVLYVAGIGNPIQGVGIDSGMYLPYCIGSTPPCTSNGPPLRSPANYWALYIDNAVYINAYAGWEWDGCPGFSDNVSAVIWERRNSGLPTHTLYVAGATAAWEASRWNFQSTTTPTSGNKAMWEVPKPAATVTGRNGQQYTFRVTVTSPGTPGTWADNSAFAKQWYSYWISPPNVVTGWDIYYKISSSAPTDEMISTGGWTKLGASDPSSTVPLDLAGGKNVTDYNATITWDGVTPIWFACRPHFADNFVPAMWDGSAFSYPVGPNSAPLCALQMDVTPNGTTTACQGAGITFYASASGGSQPSYYEYQWTENGDDIAGATGSSYTATKASAGSFSYNCRVTYTGLGECYLISAVDFTASTGSWVASPTVDVVPNGTTTACTGANIVFTATAGGGAAPYTYQWTDNGSDISGATNSTYTASKASAGSFSYNCKVASSGCATQSQDATASTGAWGAPPASVEVTPNGTTTVCACDSVVFTATASGGAAPYSYQWTENGSDISGATGSVYAAYKPSSGSYTYNCNVNSQGCATQVQDSTASTGVWAAAPSVDVAPNGTTAVCTGASITFTAVASGGTPPYTYQWTESGSDISGATNSTYTANKASAGSFTYNCKVAGQGCAQVGTDATSSTGSWVTQPSSVDVTPNGTTPVCTNASITFTASASGGAAPYSYQWTETGANISGATNSTYTVSKVSAGTFAYNCKVNSLGCATQVQDVSNSTGRWASPPSSVATYPESGTTCTGSAILFVANLTGGTSPFAYQWTENGTNISNATSSSYSANKATVGSFTYNCKVKSQYCSTVVEDASPASGEWVAGIAVNVSPDGSSAACVGGNITYTVSASGGNAPYTYQWTENGASISGATDSTYTAGKVFQGSFSYNCKVSDEGSCVDVLDPSSSTGTWASPPSVDVTPNGTATACVGAQIVYTAAATGGLAPFSYQWTEDGGDISWATNSTYTATKGSAGSHSYNCKVSSSGCATQGQDGTASTGSWGAPPSPTLSGPSEGCSSVMLGTQSYSSYQWKLGGTNISGATNSNHQATASGSYSVMVTDSAGCSGTSSGYAVTIYQNPSPQISPLSQNACPGGSTFFTVTAGGTALSYQWRKGGSDLSDAAPYSGVTTTTLHIVGISPAEAGTYDCVVTNGTCQETTAGASLTVQSCSMPMITPEPPFSLGTVNQVSWSPVTDAISYEVQSSTDNFSNVYQTSGQIAQTSYPFTGLTSGINYQYRAKAYFTVGSSEWSTYQNSTQDGENPSSSITSPLSGAVVYCDVMTVSGSASDSISGVSRVELTWDGGTTWHQAAGTTSWTYSWALPADGTYTLMSRAADNSGNIESGQGISVQVRNIPAPASGLTAADVPYDDGKAILLNWTKSADDGSGLNYVSGYEIYRSDAPNGSYAQRAYISVGRTFYEDATTPGAIWYYKVRAKTGCSVLLNYSDSSEAGPVYATDEAPKPVNNLQAELTSGCDVRLSWIQSPSPDILLYNIYYDNGTGTINYATPLGSTGSSATSWSSAGLGLPLDVRYLFTVRAKDMSGQEDASTVNVVSIKTRCEPAQPKAVVTMPKAGSVVTARGNQGTLRADLIQGTDATTEWVRFEYRPVGSTQWSVVPGTVAYPNPDPDKQYAAYLDLASLTANRPYEVRAVAKGAGGSEDPDPGTTWFFLVNIGLKERGQEPLEGESVGQKIIEDNIYGNHVAELEMYRGSGNDNQTAFGRDGNLIQVIVPPSSMPSFSVMTTIKEEDPAVFGETIKGSMKGFPGPLEEIGTLNTTGMYRTISLASGAGEFESGFDLVLFFKDTNNDGILDGTEIPVTQLDIFRRDPIVGTWTLVNQNRNVDTVNNFIHVTANQSGTYGVFSYPKPETVKNLMITKSGEDASLTWDPVTKDDKGNTISVDHYNVYYGDTPQFYPDLVNRVNLLVGDAGHPATNSTADLGALGSLQSRYYLVTAVDSLGRESYPR